MENARLKKFFLSAEKIVGNTQANVRSKKKIRGKKLLEWKSFVLFVLSWLTRQEDQNSSPVTCSR